MTTSSISDNYNASRISRKKATSVSVDPPRLYTIAIIAVKLGFHQEGMRLAHFLAEELDDPIAQQLLGTCYQMNEVPAYKEKALYWHQKAADGGYPKAEEAIEDLCGGQREHQEKSIMAAAGEWDDDEYYKRRLPEWTVVASSEEKAAVVNWYRDLATSGDSEAAFLCGLIFLCGIAVKKDDVQAHEWFRTAARLGHLPAKLMISCLYARGRGVEENQNHALEWLRDAAKGGHAESQCILGTYYARGFLVRRSYELAFEWYEKSAVQGCDWAQERLAQLYYLGRGVPRNLVFANVWARLAMNPVIDDDAPEPVVQFRNKIESEMSPEQIAESQRLAKDWSPCPKLPIDGRPDFNPRFLTSATL